jgi:hypothetical protein
MDCDMRPPTKARLGIVHVHIAIPGLTSQHSIDGLAPCADCQDPFAPFLHLKTRRKGGSLLCDLLGQSDDKRRKLPRLFCAPLPMNE